MVIFIKIISQIQRPPPNRTPQWAPPRLGGLLSQDLLLFFVCFQFLINIYHVLYCLSHNLFFLLLLHCGSYEMFHPSLLGFLRVVSLDPLQICSS